jgi:hypothetical protein
MAARENGFESLEIVSEEMVNGVTLVWTRGLPESVRDFARECLSRHPDFFLPCNRLIVGWDILGDGWPILGSVEAILDLPEDRLLGLVEASWYRYPAHERLNHLAIGLFSSALCRTGSLHTRSDGTLKLTLANGIIIPGDPSDLITDFVLSRLSRPAVATRRGGQSKMGEVVVAPALCLQQWLNGFAS